MVSVKAGGARRNRARTPKVSVRCLSRANRRRRACGAARGKSASSPNPTSKLLGRIVFHRYTNYDAWDGHLYLFDFATKRLRCLSERWEIDHAINANFSPDGKQIVFMGVPKGQHRGDAWNVYLWTINSRNQPVNLTEQPGTRDEDPRFAPDGKRIVFKQDGEIRIMELKNRQIQSIKFGGVKAERSMPMFTADAERIVYAEGARKDMDLFSVQRGRRHAAPARDRAGSPGVLPSAA